MNTDRPDPKRRYKHRKTGYFGALLAAVLAFGTVLSGCGASGGEARTDSGSGAGTPEAAQTDAGAVWNASDILGGSLAESEYVTYSNPGYADGHFLVMAYDYENAGTGTVYQIDGDGRVVSESPLGLEGDDMPSFIGFDEKGNRYFLVLRWIDEMTSETTMIAQDPDGTALWEVPVSTEGEESSPYSLGCCVEGQGIVLRTDRGADLYSMEDGSLIRRFDSGSDFYGSMCAAGDGKIVLTGSSTAGFEIRQLDLASGEFTTPESLKSLAQTAYTDAVFTGPGNSVLMPGNGVVFKADLETGETAIYLDFLQSDMEISQIDALTVSPEGRILCAGSSEDGVKHLMLLDKVDPETLANRETLVFGCSYMEESVRKQIVAFNRANDKYRIEVRDYSQLLGENGNYVETMNNDIITGNIPDIVMLDSELPVESYIAKGIFEPYDSWLESDPEIRGEDYLTNIFNAARVGGKLYEIVPSFYVLGLAGRQSVLGDIRGLTVQEAEQLIASNNIPMQTAFGGHMTQGEFLVNALSTTIDEYVDKDTGKCTFNGQGFIDLLELSAKLPKEADYTDDEAAAELETVMLDGKALLCSAWLYNFRTYTELEVATVGEPVTLVGYPSEGKSGPSIEATMRLAISASSKNKEAAWQFVRSFLLEDYQEKVDFGFPVRREALELMSQTAQERPYYINENGEKEYYDETYWVNGQEITSEPITAEKADAFIAFLESLDSFSDLDYNVYNIVAEETGAFYSGQKSAQEVADTIQSRVQIYLNESR